MTRYLELPVKVRELTQREDWRCVDKTPSTVLRRRRRCCDWQSANPAQLLALAMRRATSLAGHQETFTGEGILCHMANAETNIQQRIRLALGTRDDVRLFRNQVGQLPDPRTGRPVQFGLAKGSADIVGWTTKTITEDDVGKSYAIFTSIEVKTPTGRLTGLQQNWLHTVQTAGGFAGVARSPEDALQIISA